jgi:hypothetical protein
MVAGMSITVCSAAGPGDQELWPASAADDKLCSGSSRNHQKNQKKRSTVYPRFSLLQTEGFRLDSSIS